MTPLQLLALLGFAAFLAAFALVAAPAVLGLVVVPYVLRWNRARLRRELVALGFTDHDDGVLAGRLDGVKVKIRHRLEQKGEVIEVLAWGLPSDVELASQEIDLGGEVRYHARFVGPAQGLLWLTDEVKDSLAALAKHGELDAFEGTLSLSSPVRGRWKGAQVAHQLVAFVRLVQAQEVATLDEVLPNWPADDQRQALQYAVDRDDQRGTEEAEQLARCLLESDGALEADVHDRCSLIARDWQGLTGIITDAARPMAERVQAFERIADEDLAVAIAGVVAVDEPELWAPALRRAAETDEDAVVGAMGELLQNPRLVPHAADAALAHALSAYLHAHHEAPDVFDIPRLRALLGVDRERVRLAALRVLGTIGTVREVPDLRRREAKASGTVRYALGRAVARIQARADGNVGGVALAPGCGGELSVAESPTPA